MGVLETLLNYKNQREAQKNADINAIPQAMLQFQQSRQQATDNLLKTLTVQASLAKSGLGIGPNGQIVRDERFLNSVNKPVYTVDSQGNLTQAGNVPSKSVVKQLPLTTSDIGARAQAQREAVTENPALDEKTKGAIGALEFITPRTDAALKALDEIGEDKFNQLITQGQISVGQNNELFVPNGSPLEDLVKEINDIKLTGFSIAGSAYSDTEKRTVEGGYNPIGKSFKGYKRDILRNKDFFSSRAKAGTMGLKQARDVASNLDTYSADNEDTKLEVGGKFQGKKILKVTKVK